MAFRKENYPPYWKQFSEYIRFERAGNKCEKCGVPNGHLKYFSKIFPGGFRIVDPDMGSVITVENLLTLNGIQEFKFSKIVLTVAHLDYQGGVCQCKRFFGFKCAKPAHVQALCQACHLAIDRAKHLAVQKRNRELRKDAQRGLLQAI